MTSEWLRRSGRLPLWLDIYDEKLRRTFGWVTRRRLNEPPVESGPDPIFDAINAHMFRVVALGVHFDAPYFSLLRGEAPALRQLYLSPTRYQRDSGPVPFHLADTPPRPRRVILRNTTYNSVDIDWAGVTRFEAFSLSVDDSLLILQHSPHLIHCRIRDITTNTLPSTLPSPHINVPSLQTLVLERSRDGPSALLPHLLAPALQTLKTDAHLHIVSSFIARSKCSPRSLVLNAGQANPQELLELLEKTPSPSSMCRMPRCTICFSSVWLRQL
ncbi:unnamed protein product [Cyclocybe aegerita]|uniref:Uncharacterized protein n=1 Tax=Cyclocybe aegerita TaxID=1973307 RepID=A0A8S0XHG0_CYCAE|nr:unnamed protein product [Cyclocybe aegerita]